MGVPILLQEQNGFAGVTNKLLKNDAKVICVAYEGMERFFPAEKIILTGNPVRQNLTQCKAHKVKGEKNLLIIGGSLGARTINEAIAAGLDKLAAANINVVWQTGKVYYEQYKDMQSGNSKIEIREFLSDMPDRYATADLVISRAGASSISELCLLGKPCILVPSPNVAEDHQTHNAMALVNKDAAVLVRDKDALEQLVDTAVELIQDDKKLKSLHTNILTLAQTDSARRIAEEVIKLAKNNR
jgi:UDP-N-acetylglucosamine--N-acetylmuramyl-(pentapeptide) pyrophosphoryl-undecaprenol N-acetylglucosamine transferase